MINPLYAWIELLRSRAAIMALVGDPARVVLDLESVAVPPQQTWLVLSSVVPFRHTNLRLWRGSVRLTAFAAQMHLAQQVIDTAADDLYDDLTEYGLFHLDSGSQAGAVISVTDRFNLARIRQPLSGDVYQPAWAIDFQTQITERAMTWASS